MKVNSVKIMWGIVLIVLGGVFLADKLGYVNLQILTRQAWSIFFAASSVAFLLSYFLSGVRNWGWLFPALIFAALAWVLYLLPGDRGEFIAITILMSVGLPFYVGYLVDRKHWGLLIPAWVMTVVSVILFLARETDSDLVGTAVLFGIASPFLLVHLANRHHKWALIVASVLAFIGLFPLLDSVVPHDITGPVVMFMFSVFFLAIYLISKKLWWALIPAGIFSSIGVVALLVTLRPDSSYFMIGGLEFGGYSSVLLLGFAITFGILWLLRSTQPTAWAKYPAIGLLILSILALSMSETANSLVPAVVFLIIGVALIVGSVLKQRSSPELTSRDS